MKSRTFRLSESDIELLKRISEERCESQSDTIRYAIHKLNDEILESNTKNGCVAEDDDKNESKDETQVLSILLTQLEVKDRQIESLINQNSELQRLVDQEQKLHLAMKVDAPKKMEEAKRDSFWKRLFG